MSLDQPCFPVYGDADQRRLTRPKSVGVALRPYLRYSLVRSLFIRFLVIRYFQLYCIVMTVLDDLNIAAPVVAVVSPRSSADN